MHWKLACFDLDGTLALTSTGQHLASRIGHAKVMNELERRYLAGEISNIEVANIDGRYYAGFDQADIEQMLEDIPVIRDIGNTVGWLRDRGIPSVICTLAWQCVGQVFAERYGFMGCSGPILATSTSDVFTGEVEAHFTEHDKPVFVHRLCESLGIRMSEVFHVGDSVSDLPLFAAAGFSVAFNANRQAREAARVSLDSDSLLRVIEVVPQLAASPRI